MALSVPLLILAAAWLIGSRSGEAPGAVARKTQVRPESLPPPEAPSPAAVVSAAPEPASPRPDLRARLRRFESEDLGRLEEELEARLKEDPGFMAELCAAFLAETDPVKMSFLAAVMASDAPLRNAPQWQDRMAAVAERDPSFERRVAALSFLQEAEALRPILPRLLALAENDRDLCIHALAACKGMPERRLADPRVAELAGRIAERDPDPLIRGIALRVEEDGGHAARFLADPDRTVRMQAGRVVTSVAALEAAAAAELDPEVKESLSFRIASLKAP